jgi:O-antigen/teichoic acid export membrane protein
VQKQPAALRRYLRVFTETVALATFPAAIGLGLVARELIPLALGQKWTGVILPLEVLSAYAESRTAISSVRGIATNASVIQGKIAMTTA